MTDTGKTNWISPQRFGQRPSVDPGQGRCRFQTLPKGARPLSADNNPIRSLSGSSSPASARLHINALSPLTHISGRFNTDGCAGPRLRPCSAAAEAIPGAVLEDASGQTGRCGGYHHMDVCPGVVLGGAPIGRKASEKVPAQVYPATGWDSNRVPKAAGPAEDKV